MPRTKSPLDVEIGQRLRRMRLKRSMSQTDLGKAISVSFQQIQKYEQGTNRISTSALMKLSNVLDIATADLMGIDSKQPPSEIMSNMAIKIGYEADRLPPEFHAPLRQLLALIVAKSDTTRKVRRPRAPK